MRAWAVASIIPIVVLVQYTIAGAGPRISAGGDCRMMFGHTTYALSMCEYVPDLMLTACAESELEFPLDAFVADLNVDVEGAFAGGTPWCFGAQVRTNANDPGNPMKDSDWLGVPEWGYREKFSYTESDAELGMLIIDVSGRVAFYRHAKFRLEGILGYRYQDFTYEIFGVDGWQMDFDTGERVPYSEYKGVNVLDYDITYHVPYLGMGTRISPSPAWTIEAELLYSPKTSAKDRDDHILRNKLIEGDCQGNSYLGTLDVTWGSHRAGHRLNWFVGVGGELMHTTTEGDQEQSWYGDDPISPDDDTGLRITGIDDEITSSCQSVYVRIGTVF